jgi:4-diphosphocytidyl-2-C-methyl-D-erythritol kinase
MQSIDFCDIVELRRAEKMGFNSVGYNFPESEINLCLKAVEAISKYIGSNVGVNINLSKRIPVGAGMGGGSSDAAGILLGLNRLYNMGLKPEQLAEIGAQVGADVPFFILAPEGSAKCSGRGEIVEIIEPVWEGWVAVIYAGIHISTKQAYEMFDENLTISKKNTNLKSFFAECFPAKMGLNKLVNDFQDIVFRRFRRLRDIYESLLDYGASFSSLTGSGSAVYGLFDCESKARKALEAFPPEYFKIAVRTPKPLTIELLQ